MKKYPLSNFEALLTEKAKQLNPFNGYLLHLYMIYGQLRFGGGAVIYTTHVPDAKQILDFCGFRYTEEPFKDGEWIYRIGKEAEIYETV